MVGYAMLNHTCQLLGHENTKEYPWMCDRCHERLGYLTVERGSGIEITEFDTDLTPLETVVVWIVVLFILFSFFYLVYRFC